MGASTTERTMNSMGSDLGFEGDGIEGRQPDYNPAPHERPPCEKPHLSDSTTKRSADASSMPPIRWTPPGWVWTPGICYDWPDQQDMAHARSATAARNASFPAEVLHDAKVHLDGCSGPGFRRHRRLGSRPWRFDALAFGGEQCFFCLGRRIAELSAPVAAAVLLLGRLNGCDSGSALARHSSKSRRARNVFCRDAPFGIVQGRSALIAGHGSVAFPHCGPDLVMRDGRMRPTSRCSH